jgi:hypothetical protein
MERHQPQVSRFEVSGLTTIYIAKTAPRDVSVSVLNEGPGVAHVRFHSSQPAIQLSPGSMISANPDLPVTAESTLGCSLVVATGVTVLHSGATSTVALSGSELAALAEARTQKELLVEILLQAKLGNRYLEELMGERFQHTDLD